MRIRISCAVIATALLAAASAVAQPAFTNIGKGGPAAPATPTPKNQPPPALPGAQSNNGVAPADKSATDMEPNDALFDAINRGDLAAARDALSRGAELSARNVLGMTPMELSVDLGRNNISFMLLSLRNGSENNKRQPQTAEAAAKQSPGKQGKPVASHTMPVRQARATAPVQQPAPAETARLYSGDGGAPVPSAGFLGFDSGRR
jgi:hypothetical protein